MLIILAIALKNILEPRSSQLIRECRKAIDEDLNRMYQLYRQYRQRQCYRQCVKHWTEWRKGEIDLSKDKQSDPHYIPEPQNKKLHKPHKNRGQRVKRSRKMRKQFRYSKQ